ncbi:hypothetical protein IV417_00905 [Alphaproteobacteria bacterium KMM 3653]|uniref:Uncharacterized protein n=1 Tax=Harenicola maris TaxID=2841044 RepID=A0AAP2G2I0_9RHOB|nr:hypothetical protein [Harenicola maris]
MAPRLPADLRSEDVTFSGLSPAPMSRTGGLAQGLLRALLRASEVTPQSLPELTQAPLAATIPEQPGAMGHLGLADRIIDAPDHPYARSIGGLAAAIMQAAPPKRGQAPAVAITAPLAGQGVTTLSLSLARHLSGRGLRVALIAGGDTAALTQMAGLDSIAPNPVTDPRRPSTFGKRDLLSQTVLIGAANAFDPGGTLLSTLRSQTDIILIDAPTPQDLTKTEVQAAILTSRWGACRAAQAQSAAETLRTGLPLQTPILNALNACRGPLMSYEDQAEDGAHSAVA